MESAQKAGNAVLFWTLAVIDVVSLLVIALCPGQCGRNAVSIADLPVYATFGFGQKLYLGLLSIERVFIANADIVFFLVVLIWTWLVWEKTKDYRRTFLSALPLLILFGQTVLRTAYPGLSGLFVMPGEILEWSWSDLSTWIPMVYLAVTVAAMIYALYQLFGDDLFTFISVLLLVGCGFGAGMVLGFMATIYVSGELRVCAAVRDSSGGHTVWHLPAAQRVEGAGGCVFRSVPDGADSCLLCGERIVYRFVIVRPEV